MGCNLLLLLLVSGLLTEGAHAIFCYQCDNCEGTEGEGNVLDCSIANSNFCFTIKNIDTGEIRKFCGIDEINFLGLSNSCDRQDDQTYCHCDTDLCNTNDLLPSTTSTIAASITAIATVTTTVSAPTTTTTIAAPTTTITISAPTTATAVFTPGEEPWTCYSCYDCGNSTGEIETCSLIPAVTDCHLIKYPSGKIQRSCGRSIPGTEMVNLGCSRTYRGYQWCRCNQRNCNEYPEITKGAPDTTTVAIIPETTTVQEIITAMESSDMALNSSLSPQQSTTTSIQNTTTGEPPFFCYVCRNCGSTTGFLVDCSPYTESKTCLLMKQPNEEVLRSCGTTEQDAQLRSGCHTRRGYTFCKCSENACNVYPEVTGVTTTIPPTTTEPPFLCHICHDCGTELGPSLQCTSANSCSFILQQGIVIRGCGSPLLDLVVTGDEGCTTTDDGQICKCSTPNCNIYSDITDNAN